MGGEILAESEKGKGTVFTIKLPVAIKEGVSNGDNGEEKAAN
jgi:signal transduction histidine kinase